MNKEPEAVVVDYTFLIPTERFGNFAFGLVRNGHGWVGAKEVTETDENFYRLMGQNMENLGLVEIASRGGLIITGPADTIRVDGAVRSLPEVVEELYFNDIEIQRAGKVIDREGKKDIPSLGRPGFIYSGVVAVTSSVAKSAAALLTGDVLSSIVLGAVVGLAAFMRDKRPALLPLRYGFDLQRKQEEQENLAKSIRHGLVDIGLDRGIIPLEYLLDKVRQNNTGQP
ncbi:hypothetical protein HYY73_02175 [Candidatus Woesearchaeota archaeon]|nr:hypothetical protein [Candidatus Woesearchaeota archaeon]